jgi:hypothetical protein
MTVLIILVIVLYVVILVLGARAAVEPYLVGLARPIRQKRRQPADRGATNETSSPKDKRPAHPSRAA